MKKLITILFSVVLLVSCGALLIACESSKEFTVTYVYDNGQDNLVTTVAAGGTAVRPKDPIKDNFTFDGWYIDGGGAIMSFPSL